MMILRNWRRPTGGCLVAAVLVAACTDADEPSSPDDGPTSASVEDNEPDEPSGAAGTIELSGWQQSHANGTTVAVTQVTVDDQGDIYVSLEALATRTGSTYLANFQTLLLDDLGNRYEFVPPEQNPSLVLAQDTVSQLTLAFVGPIDPAATRLSLGLNGDDDELQTADDGLAATGYPSFAFEDLPLPGVGLDDEAAGPDDPIGLQRTESSVDVDGVVHEGPAQLRIEVTSIEVAPGEVRVTIEARNNGSEERNVLEDEPRLRAERDGQSFGDDAPFQFQRLTTEDGQFDRLSLGPGDEATAEFAFRGSVPETATGLRLGLQALSVETDRGTLNAEETATSSPRVIFTGLPLPEGFAGANAALESEFEEDDG